MADHQKIYFASDFHLGAPRGKASRDREDRVVAWLRHVAKDATAIYLMGDVFDFWFEYKHAIPKGFSRLLGTLSDLTDRGIEVHLFTGNHDMWMFDYLPEECGVQIHRTPIERTWGNKLFFLGHGDGLGPGDTKYKMLKWFFASRLCQWLFARFHPNFGIGLAQSLSRYSRVSSREKDAEYLGDDREWLMVYCREVLQKKHYDYFIFGHRHMPLDKDLGQGSRYINLGEWISQNRYAVWDGERLELLTWIYPG
jgi:UDP-2,3-diacylglucosamine hydrolase